MFIYCRKPLMRRLPICTYLHWEPSLRSSARRKPTTSESNLMAPSSPIRTGIDRAGATFKPQRHAMLCGSCGFFSFEHGHRSGACTVECCPLMEDKLLKRAQKIKDWCPL